MNYESMKMLEEEIQSALGDLDGVDATSEEYKVGAENIAKLMDRAIAVRKLESEEYQKNKALEQEQTLRTIQMENEKRDRLISNCITVAGIVLPIGVTIWGTLKSLKFEETGTVTTIMGRGFINKLLPRK